MIDWRERISLGGQIIISAIIIAGFVSVRIMMIFVEILPANQRSADTFDGALIGGFSAVIGFWIGSSSGGQKKDATIAQMAAAATPTPTITTTSSPSGAATVTTTGIPPEAKHG